MDACIGSGKAIRQRTVRCEASSSGDILDAEQCNLEDRPTATEIYKNHRCQSVWKTSVWSQVRRDTRRSCLEYLFMQAKICTLNVQVAVSVRPISMVSFWANWFIFTSNGRERFENESEITCKLASGHWPKNLNRTGRWSGHLPFFHIRHKANTTNSPARNLIDLYHNVRDCRILTRKVTGLSV